MSSSEYNQPTALIIISSVSIGLGAIAAAWILLDIIWRRGWRSMMYIMIPVYAINALYLWPITLWVYVKYGRPPLPQKHGETRTEEAHQPPTANASGTGGEEKQGCVLGDIVGEWLVYGTNAAFGSPPRLLWAEMLVDFGFAFLFGIVFQYFSIAPMAGEYGPKIVYRALKADALSLLFFEIGLFGWMAIFQIAIFSWELEMPTVTYWWMMQIGMFLGHWTGVPINWWLINTGVKMPCA
ncbi:hypothetical protein KC353_g2209 [Hortaea werneckii]|nr:hypothetical protein KC353_g2209 [Hortaea werneckii]